MISGVYIYIQAKADQLARAVEGAVQGLTIVAVKLHEAKRLCSNRGPPFAKNCQKEFEHKLVNPSAMSSTCAKNVGLYGGGWKC